MVHLLNNKNGQVKQAHGSAKGKKIPANRAILPTEEEFPNLHIFEGPEQDLSNTDHSAIFAAHPELGDPKLFTAAQQNVLAVNLAD